MPTDDEMAEGLKPFNDRGPTDEDLLAMHERSKNIGPYLETILETCDVFGIAGNRNDGWTVMFGKADQTDHGVVHGDDYAALLEEVAKRVS